MGTVDLNNIVKQYELVQESSLLRKYDKTFQQDVDRLKEKFKELCESPATQAMFEKAKTEKGAKYLKKKPENCFKVKLRFRTGVHVSGEKSFLMIKVLNAPDPSGGHAEYDPNNDSIVFNFYVEGFVAVSKINPRFQILDWYKHNLPNVESVLAHELSHLYKRRFHMRKPGSNSLVTPIETLQGTANSADYAMYDDEKESMLAEIWQDMLKCNADGKQTFNHCLLQSPVFKKILKSFGVSTYKHKADQGTSVISNVDKLRNLDKGYKDLYNYFMKKTYELWQDKGFKFNDPSDQMYTHKLQQFATTLDKDLFNEFSDEEKSKVLKTDIESPLDVFNTLDVSQKKIYISSTPPLNQLVYNHISQEQQQDYTLQRYRKITKSGIQNDLDIVLLKKNKRLFDIIMLPEIKKAKKQEQEIRDKVVNRVYIGDVVVVSKYVLPNLSDVIISGDYTCSNLSLTSLQGAPKGVVGTFDCSHNNLKTLEHSPKDISKNFDCSHNNIANLTGSPLYVERNFYCTNNRLKTLENGPKQVDGDYHCDGNVIEDLSTAKTRVKGLFFSNQFSNEDFKRRTRNLKTESVIPTFKQFLIS